MTRQIPEDIIAAFQRSDMAEAERLSRARLEASPDDADLLFGLAMALQQQGKDAEAAAQYRRLTELAPEVPAHWTNLATALRMAGDGAAAVLAARRAVELDPRSSSRHVVLGQALLAAGDPPAAQEALLKACELDPASIEARLNAANALVLVRDAQAYVLLRNWRQWLPLDPPDQIMLAHMLATTGDADAACLILEELTRRVPGNATAQLQLATLYERRNELDRSEDLLSHVSSGLKPQDATSKLEIAHLHATLVARRGDYVGARSVLETAGPRTPLDYAHWFLLADVLDRQGETREAMEALAIAHTSQVEDLTPLMPKLFGPDSAVMPKSKRKLSPDQYAKWPRLSAPNGSQTPVFIVGFPRSGTTLLEQMLDAHPALQSMDEQPFFTILTDELSNLGVRIPDELYRLNQRDCDELRMRYLELVSEKIRRRWSAQLVDKNPLNMLELPIICRLFPQAKIILALRHPCDVVLSNYMQNYRSCMLASACSTLERTAKAYAAAFEAWDRDTEILKPTVHVSRYEELVADPPRQAERFAEFLGLDDAAPMLDYDKRAKEKGFIATPSYTEVIRPISAARTERWRRYQHEFEPVLPILAPMLKRWNYKA